MPAGRLIKALAVSPFTKREPRPVRRADRLGRSGGGGLALGRERWRVSVPKRGILDPLCADMSGNRRRQRYSFTRREVSGFSSSPPSTLYASVG
ncbi:hypothetical protein D1114_15145 [Cereibacter sphaeroides]|uniref:Uncharacterized protein n=1 Tax=Cereibacter sphaeroides TaxID=1063 RepID=A0AAX1UJ61_CERSP|nr:hypothetical protein D1114_15145 [Cereibacter sphaeroides]